MDVNRILLDILVVLLAAKLAAEVADRVNMPAVVGEIIAGVIIGPSVLGWVHDTQALSTLAQLGVILLLLEVGLEMDLDELGSVGRAAVSVAVVGVVLPFVGGALTGLAIGMKAKEAIFVGAALTATSVGITACVFGDLRALATVEARTVLGAAVADDILGLVILTVVVRVVTQGSVSASGVISVVLVGVGFVVVSALLGVRIVPPIFAFVRRHSRSAGTLVAIALAFTLGIAELAHAAKLAPIVGAFVAGIALAPSPAAGRVRHELAPVAHLLVPVFFLQIGIDAQVRQFGRLSVLGTAGLLLVVAIVGKLASVIGMAGSPGDRFLVGVGMIPRGEVGLIFATIGLSNHVFGQDIYAALLLVVLLTTIAPPPVLRSRLLRLRAQRVALTPSATGEGAGLVEIGADGDVTLAGEPAERDALVVALRAARLCATHRPGPALLDWLDAFPPGPKRWDDAARSELFALLRQGNERSWRLMTASTVLQQSIPELDDALAARRHDPLQMDPLASLRFERLANVNELLDLEAAPQRLQATILAALVLDASEDDTVVAPAFARRVAQRIGVGVETTETVVALVRDAFLLIAAAQRHDGLAEESVLQLAVHIGSLDQAHALHVLTVGGDPSSRREITALYYRVCRALNQPDEARRETADEVQYRRARAQELARDEQLRARIAAAPRSYVLSQSPADLARQAAMCEPPPSKDEVRVNVLSHDDHARVEVVARDRVGLLAACTRVLSEAGYSVRQAVATTWADGTALACYDLDPADLPAGDTVRAAFSTALAEPLVAEPIEHVDLEFDDAGSPWHTRCTVVAPDRPGLLHALTAAFAVARVNVHAARITTDGSRAVDHFDLTDRRGAKLDERAKAAVASAITHGGRPKRRPLSSNRRLST